MTRPAPRARSRPATGAVLLAVLAAAAASLAGCSSAVQVDAAPEGADPVCAAVFAALPDEVAGGERRDTTSQGSSAWGEPPVVLRCGVEVAGPTSDPCQVVEAPDGTSVDWVVSEPQGGRVVWTTYGRTPAVELSMPDVADVTAAAPLDVAEAVALVEQQRACT